jgi:GntR family transcriptional regulator
MPSAEEAQRLMMAPGTPLLVHTRVGYDAEGRPVRYMVSRMAADRVEVSYDLDA